MRIAITIWVALGALLFSFSAYAGEKVTGTGTLIAEKVCSPQIDIFNVQNVESLLDLSAGEKIASYQVVLFTPGQELFKYDTRATGNFKTIMARVKEHATAGSMLFVDNIKTVNGVSLPPVEFYLR